MHLPGFAPCSDLATHQIKWISRTDQINNGFRPASHIQWGISAVSIAAQYAETYADEPPELIQTSSD
jgi:hypothetical protein